MAPAAGNLRFWTGLLFLSIPDVSITACVGVPGDWSDLEWRTYPPV